MNVDDISLCTLTDEETDPSHLTTLKSSILIDSVIVIPARDPTESVYAEGLSVFVVNSDGT